MPKQKHTEHDHEADAKRAAKQAGQAAYDREMAIRSPKQPADDVAAPTKKRAKKR